MNHYSMNIIGKERYTNMLDEGLRSQRAYGFSGRRTTTRRNLILFLTGIAITLIRILLP